MHLRPPAVVLHLVVPPRLMGGAFANTGTVGMMGDLCSTAQFGFTGLGKPDPPVSAQAKNMLGE